MKAANKISALILTCLFLLSNTGISLVMHHCFACDTTDYYNLFTGLADHHQHYDHECNTGACCDDYEKETDSHKCGIFGSLNNCCKTEVEYYKNDYETFLKYGSDKSIQLLSLSSEVYLNDICYSEDKTGKLLQDYIEPPPKLVSRAFIIFTNKLKFC